MADEVNRSGEAYQYTGFQPADIQPVAAGAPIETLPGQYAGAPIEAVITKAENAVTAAAVGNQGSTWFSTPEEAQAYAEAQAAARASPIHGAAAAGVSPLLGAVGAQEAIPIQSGVISGAYSA